MAIQPLSEEGTSAQETVAQQSILQQAEAAIVAQPHPTRSTRQEPLLQETELIDAAEDDVPPPAYGDIYGEIHDKKDALGARVTDDGRVNIRINQLNRRLSQVFTPALRQHVRSVHDSHPPPLPYIPPSLGGEEGVPPPPSLNVVIQVVGSRGDVQPFVALGKVLKDTYGHRVRLATHPNFKGFVQGNGLEFFSIGGDPSQLMGFMVKNPGLMPGFRSLLSGDVGQRRRDVARYIQGCWRSCYEGGDGMARSFVADCIIANPPSFAHIHCAEKLGIPLHIMFTMPYSPTQAFPHPLANIQSSNADPQLTNYISYAMIEVLMWQGLGDIINRFRVKCLGLDPVSLIWAPGMLQRLKVPHTYCWSPALIAKPNDWGSHLASSYTPAPDLQAFLDAGPPPIYIGFGSIVLDDSNAMTELIFEAARKTGQRVLLSKGWGGIGAEELRIPGGVFMLDNVPHDWLFKHVSCVIHHGGAGTTAAGIAAGRPTLVVPFFGDQLFWGAMIARAGAGPDPIPHRQLTADKLADAINVCLKAETMERAKELAGKIEVEQGSDMGAQSFHQHLEVDRLRCILASSRAATWRVKRSQVRLSAFAACTLANANLLDFHDLKLFRPQEYYTDEGPWDPLSGFAAAVFGAISSSSSDVSRTRVRSRNESSTGKDHDMLRQTGAHTSKGFGRIVKTALRSPIDLSMSITEGFHNAPKLWGDDTVRPPQKVSDLKSGAKAVGKEFAFGWYDGVTGLVTQPLKGAQKEGASGLLKGIGKGIGGFLTKPGAALFGIPSYMMKGVHKEVQKLFGSSVQNYIIASRTAQGYEEWLQSSDAEKQDVIVRWKLIQKYLKKRHTSDEMVRDILESQRKINMEERNDLQTCGTTVSSAQSARSADTFTQDRESVMLALGRSESPLRSTNMRSEESLEQAETNETGRLSVQEPLRGDAKENANVERAIQENIYQLQRQQEEAADHQIHEENLRRAIEASEAEAQRHAREASEYEEQLKLVTAQSLREQRRTCGDSEWELDIGLDDEDDEELQRARKRSGKMTENAGDGAGSSPDVQQPHSYDSGHLAGTTQSEFEAQQQEQEREKTAQEKTEEEIVMEYVKKQSLLEKDYRNKGKSVPQ
ncbi:glycosyltransferase family 1 protein [Rutstroemia sp. NJR-2017a BBW]|nr:glycosyltransferase family 1 protein [Rutstroemia sp. NJR-2017a BBW]